MELKPISLTEFKQTVAKSRDSACARLEAAGDDASVTDRFLAESAQTQIEFLDELSDEPLTFAELEAQEVAPHLLRQVATSATNGQKQSESDATWIKTV